MRCVIRWARDAGSAYLDREEVGLSPQGVRLDCAVRVTDTDTARAASAASRNA